VVDEYQRRGVGTSLLEALAAHAQAHGIDAFRADVLAQNLPVITAVERLGGTVHSSRAHPNVVEALLPLPLRRSALAAAG
jgi:ribosomal protein S18 acetylase RimI-like enzyme